jgi:hypothetical protein
MAWQLFDASIILLIISGTAGVVLTVWGRVMPPDTPRAKKGFVAVGAVSVFCIISAGIINAVSQNKLENTLATVVSKIQNLAEVADVQKDTSTDRILSAAASKLQEQNKELEDARLRIAALERPHLDPSKLYQNKIPVADVGTISSQSGSAINFDKITTIGQMDINQTFEFRDWRLRCVGQRDGGVGFGASVHWDWYNVSCGILGPR